MAALRGIRTILFFCIVVSLYFHTFTTILLATTTTKSSWSKKHWVYKSSHDAVTARTTAHEFNDEQQESTEDLRKWGFITVYPNPPTQQAQDTTSNFYTRNASVVTVARSESKLKSATTTDRAHPTLGYSSSAASVSDFDASFRPNSPIAETTLVNENVYQYNICNGLSNQLLIHSASIAFAIAQNYVTVEIPDYFIVHGVQTGPNNVLPTPENSVNFGTAFDQAYFKEQIKAMGIKLRFVKFFWVDDENNNRTVNVTRDEQDNPRHPPECRGLENVARADPYLLLKVMEAFRPSAIIKDIIRQMTSSLGEDRDIYDAGVCVHHRTGLDWRSHCRRWSNLTLADGIYRGNCLGPGRLREPLLARILDDGHHWVYYCGDWEKLPALLSTNFTYTIQTRHTMMSEANKEILQSFKPGQPVRDLWALIDFSVCRDLGHFIGNSVSTFSALQVALRKGTKAYWYNSQSIPLASMWRVFQIPIVYTYTEFSEDVGKHLLKASIISVRNHMPHNQIHILYHGSADMEFYMWMKEHGVTIHRHEPKWKDAIEKMRKQGQDKDSHLFAHAGNYLGTWQRIDIPLFLDTEYALFLDSDTIISRPFTIADFGSKITRTVAFSCERVAENQPLNAGVVLMNIPHLRVSYKAFVTFISQHTHSPLFARNIPSDQGAFMEFYQPTFLSRCFNFKPYYDLDSMRECGSRPYIIHFHGPKPHDYLLHLTGHPCNVAKQALCHQAKNQVKTSLCLSMQMFAVASNSVGQDAYCDLTMGHITTREAAFCKQAIHSLAKQEGMCLDLSKFV